VITWINLIVTLVSSVEVAWLAYQPVFIHGGDLSHPNQTWDPL